MNELVDANKIILTPNGTYDDLVLLKIAAIKDGAVVSNDQFRDILNNKNTSKGELDENDLIFLKKDKDLLLFFAAVRKVINERRIPFTIFGDVFLPAEDPYGRGGPSLGQVLRIEIETESA